MFRITGSSGNQWISPPAHTLNLVRTHEYIQPLAGSSLTLPRDLHTNKLTTIHARSPIHDARTKKYFDARARTNRQKYIAILSISLPLRTHTQTSRAQNPPPLTAPDLADDTTHSGSLRTYNAAACRHTRKSWRASISARDDVLAGNLASSRYLALATQNGPPGP
jgi:hypothetical protein